MDSSRLASTLPAVLEGEYLGDRASAGNNHTAVGIHFEGNPQAEGVVAGLALQVVRLAFPELQAGRDAPGTLQPSQLQFSQF